MTVRIFKHDRNELLKQGIEIISSTNDTKYHNRVVLVNLLLTGKISISLMSKASGLTTRTLPSLARILLKSRANPCISMDCTFIP